MVWRSAGPSLGHAMSPGAVAVATAPSNDSFEAVLGPPIAWRQAGGAACDWLTGLDRAVASCWVEGSADCALGSDCARQSDSYCCTGTVSRWTFTYTNLESSSVHCCTDSLADCCWGAGTGNCNCYRHTVAPLSKGLPLSNHFYSFASCSDWTFAGAAEMSTLHYSSAWGSSSSCWPLPSLQSPAISIKWSSP